MQFMPMYRARQRSAGLKSEKPAEADLGFSSNPQFKVYNIKTQSDLNDLVSKKEANVPTILQSVPEFSHDIVTKLDTSTTPNSNIKPSRARKVGIREPNS
jgi:hypothetical protein